GRGKANTSARGANALESELSANQRAIVEGDSSTDARYAFERGRHAPDQGHLTMPRRDELIPGTGEVVDEDNGPRFGEESLDAGVRTHDLLFRNVQDLP